MIIMHPDNVVRLQNLDQLVGNINGLSALGTAVAGDASTAHYALDQITATFNVSGAVDEDHRQLSVLQDETNQSIVVIDRLLMEVSNSVQRQTAYVANERANLTALSSAIKSGEFYGADMGAPLMAASATSSGGNMFAYSGTPLVVIRFDQRDVAYDYGELDEVSLAYAITIHKSHGSEFPVVVIPIATQQCVLLQRNLVYTRHHPWQKTRGAGRPKKGNGHGRAEQQNGAALFGAAGEAQRDSNPRFELEIQLRPDRFEVIHSQMPVAPQDQLATVAVAKQVGDCRFMDSSWRRLSYPNKTRMLDSRPFRTG